MIILFTVVEDQCKFYIFEEKLKFSPMADLLRTKLNLSRDRVSYLVKIPPSSTPRDFDGKIAGKKPQESHPRAFKQIHHRNPNRALNMYFARRAVACVAALGGIGERRGNEERGGGEGKRRKGEPADKPASNDSTTSTRWT